MYEYIEKNDEFIVPQSRKKEILGFLRTERLKDFSISRTSFKWGIDVPDSKTHIMYVWIDALTNYISSLGGWESEEYEHYWNQTIHFLGKDILRFHAVYWPCMLKAAGVPLPQHIVAHGWWTISDKKISKSDPATKVNPVKIANDITIDGLRFYLLKETSLDRDGNLDYNHLIEVLNTYLANKIGNLVNRTVSMVNKYLEGNVKELKGEVHYHFKQSVVIKQEALNMRQQVIKQMRGFAPSEALDEIIKYVDLLNGYIDITMPWKLAKDNEKEKLEELFAILVEGIRWMSSYLNIFLPDISSLINKQFYFKNDELPTEFVLDRKITTEHADIIYQRIDNKSGEQLIKKWQGVECV